jgi:hypothetical protein
MYSNGGEGRDRTEGGKVMSNSNCPWNDDPDMAGCRSRNEGDGRLRAKRSDTHVGTIEDRYGVDLGMRRDAHLGTALDRYGVDSLSELLRAARGQK